MEGIKWEKKVFRCATIVVAVVRAAVFVRKMRLKWKKTLRDFYTPILMKRNVWLVAYVWKLVHWVRKDQRKSYLLIWNVISEEIIPLSNIANCCNVKYTVNKRTKLHAFAHSFCLNSWIQMISINCGDGSSLADAIMDCIFYNSYKIDIESVNIVRSASYLISIRFRFDIIKII